MTPTSFSFKLSVPKNSEVMPVVEQIASQASTYAQLDEGAIATFVKQLSDATAKAFMTASGSHCQIVITGSETELNATVGGETVTMRR